MSSSPSARWCPWTAAYSSSSSASPASRRNGDPKAGLGACGGGDVVRLLDELVDPELECPLPTASVTLISPLCRRDIRFLFDFSNDSSISTWIVATIGACRSCGGGGDWRASTCVGWDTDGVEWGFFRRVTGIGLWQRSSSGASDPASSSSNIAAKRGGRTSRFA